MHMTTIQRENGLTIRQEADQDYQWFEEVAVPDRPPLKIGDAFIEIALKPVEGAFEFGTSDCLGDPLLLVAKTADGAVLATNDEQLFPGEDFENNPDYQRLIQYIDVAESEAFNGNSYIAPGGPWRCAHWFFECPATSTEKAYDFAPEELRCYREGSTWDGLTLVGNEIVHGRLSEVEWARFRPYLQGELRLRAFAHSIAGFPEHDRLIATAHEVYVTPHVWQRMLVESQHG